MARIPRLLLAASFSAVAFAAPNEIKVFTDARIGRSEGRRRARVRIGVRSLDF
jgi:hypothetical protein